MFARSKANKKMSRFRLEKLKKNEAETRENDQNHFLSGKKGFSLFGNIFSFL
jgi:hypothetical protein